ncbi:MAG: cbb3-type cytochrome c oxidase subunit I, partial [Clostridia bacterium]|nr:cbb3-type cytochrome c oxidase subunit I [Clostridia bacterium]
MDAQAQSLAGARRVVLWNLYVAFLALLVGGLMGPFQALENAGVNLYRFLPFLHSYYQGLTIHGVLLALVWTTFFIAGFLQFVTIHGLRRPLYSLRLAQVAFALMVVGLVAAAVPILANQATVLFTSYAPLKAHPAYYVGLALVVVGTWLISANVYLTHRDWRRQHPGERTPLMVTGAIVTLIMWDIASLGIAAEFLGLLIPMALGLTVGTNPLLARTLFWFTGHPIVYFWLLPAYISWYTMMPKQVGGKLFSDPLARLAFLLFIPFSVPVGFHHQYTDPGVPQAWKMVHALLTFAVFFPSLLTAFTVVASLETGARARGGKGALRWLTALPWGDPSVASQLLAMVLFAFGGVSGLVNASYNLNLLVHNTAWVVGHFHLTVGTAVTLSFIGIAYWLIPHLTGRALWSRRMALWQAWLWFIGMAAFSRGMHWLGLLGAPRRTMLGASVYPDPQWQPALALVSSSL